MLRKVIQISDKTLVLSLPAEWTKKYNISKGDSLEVQERDSFLITSSSENLSPSKVSIDISGISPKAIKRVLGGAFKSGYDEIELRVSSKEDIDAVKKTLSISIKTFEILGQTDTSLILKNLAEIRYDEFDQMLRRIFLLLLKSMQDTVSANSQDDLDAIIETDLEINNCADYCRRILNKKGYAVFAKTPAVYYIVEQLEKIGDLIRDFAKENNKKDFKIYSEVAQFLRDFYELYYTFELKKFDLWISKFEGLSQKSKNCSHLISSIVEEIYALNGALLVCRL